MTKTPTPLSVLDAFADAWNAKDIPGLGALFVADADFVNVVGLWWRKRRDIELAHGWAFDRYFSAARMQWLEQRQRQLNEGAAVVHGKWSMTGQVDEQGEPAAGRQGILSLVVIRADGDWRAVSAQNTDIVPGTQTFVARDGELRASGYTPSRKS